jgi:hypothetical protein
MKVVKLVLPYEVTEQLGLEAEFPRDVPSLLLAVDGLDMAASITTLASLRDHLPQVAERLRAWVMRRPSESGVTRLLIKGDNVDIAVVLPPNVGTASIMETVAKLLVDQHCEDGHHSG